MDPSRASTRLAEKNGGTFVPIDIKAIQCKALCESLMACSAKLKKHIKIHKILKRKNPMGALDLGQLAKVTS